MPDTTDTPASLRDDAADALRKADDTFNSVEYMLLEEEMDEDERAKSAKKRIQTGIALQKLRNAELSAIADQLEADSDELKSATRELNDALEDLQAIKPFLDGVTALLKVVARVVALV